MRVLSDLALADHPEALVLGGSLGADRLDDTPPLVWVGVADVKAGVLVCVNELLTYISRT